MIHISLPDKLRQYHLAYIKKDGKLLKELNNIKDTYNNDICTKIIDCLNVNFDCLVAGTTQDLEKLLSEYLLSIYSCVNTDKDEDISDFNKVHQELQNCFMNAYERFISTGLQIKDKQNNDILWNSYTYLKELDVNVCPYCNVNFIVTVESNVYFKNAGSKTRADLDHFIPKSILPIFAISLSNLIPGCTSCNQRFKSAYNTNLKDFYSPFDSEIKNKFKFQINYGKSFICSFQNITKISKKTLDDTEQHYNEVLDKIEILNKGNDYKKKLEDKVDALNKKLNEIESLSSTSDIKPKGVIPIVDNYISKCKEIYKFSKEFSDNIFETMFIENSNFVKQLNNKMIQLEGLWDDFEIFSSKRGHQKIKSAFNQYKSEANKILKQAQKYFKIGFPKIQNSPQQDNINFVDMALGYNHNYSIEIVPLSTDIQVQRKVYNNVALFQLEAVYQAFVPYINKKIKQSYIVNDIYLQQLSTQFPKVLTNLSLIDFLSVDKSSIKDEPLGKLINDVIIPTITSVDHKAKIIPII